QRLGRRHLIDGGALERPLMRMSYRVQLVARLRKRDVQRAFTAARALDQELQREHVWQPDTNARQKATRAPDTGPTPARRNFMERRERVAAIEAPGRGGQRRSGSSKFRCACSSGSTVLF